MCFLLPKVSSPDLPAAACSSLVYSTPLVLFRRHRSMAIPRSTHDLVSPEHLQVLGHVIAGIVHWTPPAAALDLASEVIRDKGVSAYGPCAGLPALVGALRQKLAAENGLPGVRTAAPRPLCALASVCSRMPSALASS